MKKKIFTISAIIATMMFAGCSEKKQEKAEDAVEEVMDDAEAVIDTAAAKIDSTAERVGDKIENAVDGKSITVTGKVTEIFNGKDGYTAKIETAGGKKYSATISIPNLDDPKQYRAVKVGEEITVKGEVTNLEDDMLIRVSELKK